MSSPMQSQSAPCLALKILDYNFYGPVYDIFSFDPVEEHRCHHLFSINRDRTFLPQDPSTRPDDSTKWTLALTCQRCRVHIDSRIDFSDSRLVCPTHNDPLHHFVYVEPEDPPREEYPRKYNFRCTKNLCVANLWVILRPPELRPQEVEYLLDVQPRMDATLQTFPTAKQRNTVEALAVFRSYIQGCLDNKDRSIPTRNTAFLSCIGEGGSDMMRRLGFTLGPDADGKPAWLPPKVPVHDADADDIAFDMRRCELEDVREELTTLMQNRPAAEKRSNIPDVYGPPPGDSKIALSILLGIPNYNKVAPTQPRDENQRLGPYLGLGALPDFDDQLIAWCYDRQTRTLEGNIPFYFRCLKDISQDRQSEELATKAMTLESRGIRTDLEIQDAWDVIGIDANHYHLLNDNNILSRFQSRYQDSGTNERQRMLQALSIIADFRQSALLKDAANGTLETYEQALVFLGAEADTSDEYILSLKTVKEQEAQDQWNQARALKALEIIAQHRQSNLLTAALQGDQPEPRMDVSQAYAVLGAEPGADDDTLLFAFPDLMNDNPFRKTEIIQAMMSIAEARNSRELKAAVEDARQGQDRNSAQTANLEEPRGLENIGNTCYLNSFLQYLYTVKPLRELVENMEQERQEISSGELFMKMVSDERVTKSQVQRAQSFIDELKSLFDQLKTSRKRAVKLERSLAALTVAPTGDWTATREQEKRRRSTLVSSKPPRLRISLDASDTLMNGTSNTLNSAVIDLTESPLEDNSSYGHSTREIRSESTGLQTATETTLPNNDTINPALLVNGQSNDAQAMDVSAIPRTVDSEPIVIDGVSPHPAESITTPPPVPPRKEAEAPEQFADASKEKIEEWARQQDMREALANVFRQFRWALKDEKEPDGHEQIDLISRLFYGQENIVTGTTNDEQTVESIPFHALYVIPDESYETIYSMLDGAYGFREITDETSQKPRIQYSTFSELPPVLHIDVAVTTWDKEAQHAVRRAPFKVAESFYMDRYRDDPLLIEKRKQSDALTLILRELKAKRLLLTQNEVGLDMPNVLRHVRTYLTRISGQSTNLGLPEDLVDESLLKTLNELADSTQQELDELDARIEAINSEMNALFPEDGQLLYRLHAVCVHVGRAESGHYYIYLNNEQCWYKYNDETVEKITDASTVMNPSTGSSGVPAMLVYVRDSLKQDLMQTVCREPAEAPDNAMHPGHTAQAEDRRLRRHSITRYLEPKPFKGVRFV